MKKIILITVLTLFNYQLNAQSEKYPKGIYMSFQEILDKTPLARVYDACPTILSSYRSITRALPSTSKHAKNDDHFNKGI